MSYYPALKQRLTCREVAPRYGLKVNASGMALCPFHDEHSPSLKLSRGFHCFGCGAQGDVITFVSRLFGIPPGEAAQKLSADFGIPAGDHSRGPPAARTEMETWISYAKEILHGYYDLLIDWKQRYCPKALDEEWHPLFIEALQRQADIRQLIFELEFGTTEEVKTVYEHYKEVVKKIGKRHSCPRTLRAGAFSAFWMPSEVMMYVPGRFLNWVWDAWASQSNGRSGRSTTL